MNRFFTIILLAVCFGAALHAQSVPQGFNYQTVIRDATGSAYANQTVTLLFSIRNGAANGPISYTERHIANTNEYGLVNLVIGQGTVLQGDFNTINWGGGPKYLTASVETSPNVFDELGSTQLMSVPYALFALNGGGGGGSGDNWGSQTAQTDYSLKGSGTVGDPLGLSPQEAQPGQVLKWDGTKWTPQDDIANTGTNGGTITQINTNSGIVGGPITTTGTIGLSNTGVTPGTYGSATQIPVVTVDAQGRVSSVFTVVPSPGTIGINGGTGIAVQQNGTSFTITNIGDTNAGDDLTNTSQANGDVTGPFSNLQIAAGVVGNTELATNAVNTANIVNGAITAAKLNSMSATNGQVLKWNGTAWAPAADQGGSSYSAGTGISITGAAPNQAINNTGDTNAADDITNTSTSGGDVSGTFANLQIVANAVGTNEIANGSIATADLGDQAVTGAKIDDMGATSGQVLKWNGTTWAPATDNAGSGNITINAGNGIAVFGGGSTFTISNEGDVDALDDVTNVSQAGGDLSGVFSNLQLKTGVVGINELGNNSVASNNIINNSIVAADLNNMGATNGQVLAYNGSAWAPTTLSGGGAGDNWGTQTAQTNATLSGNGTQASPLGIAAQGATNGQVLKYTGVTWVPEDDTWGTQVVIANPTIAGNGTAGNPLRIATQSATMGQVLQYNGATWVPASVSGDNWGAQSAETDVTLEGDGTVANPLKIAKQGAVDGQVLQFDGSNWVPANVSGDDWGAQVAESDATIDGDGSAGSPLKIGAQGATNGQTLKFTGLTWVPANDTWGAQVVVANTTLSGNGTAASPLRIAAQGAASGQVLKWNGSTWMPGDDLVGTGGGTGNTYNAGTGINITGIGPNFTIDNTGDLDETNELQTLSLVGTALTLSNGGGTVNIPSGGNNYSAGTAISITGSAPNFTINNIGDPSSTNEIQALSLVGNNLSLSNGGGTVAIDPSSTNEIQSLSLAGNALTLSNGGGTVNLPAGNNYTAGTGIGITGSAPNFTITNTGDPSITNELQNLSLNGTTLKISGTNSTVQFDTLFSSGGLGLWKNNGTHIFNNNTGNVGINTNNPTTKLHVKGGGETVRIEGVDPMISFSASASGVDGFLWQRNGNFILGTQDSSNIILQTGASNSALTVGGVSGNVVIGAPDPGAAKLKVVHNAGGFMLENASGNNWEFFVQEGTGNLVLFTNPLGPQVPVGAFAPNGVYMSSDKKLKKNIVGLPSVLDKLNQLEPVSYKFNFQNEKDSESYGFIAQDVQTLFPNMVSTNPGRDGQPSSLMVNYSGLGVIAIKAVQEQQVQINQLKSENAELRARLDAIEAKLKK